MKPKTASAALVALTVFVATARAQELPSQDVKQRMLETQRELVRVKSDIRRLQVDAAADKAAQQSPVPEDLRNKELRDAQATEQKRQLDRLQALAVRLQSEVEQVTAESQRAASASPARDKLLVRIYPLRDFTDGDALLRVITTTIEPQSWADRGGAATIIYFMEGKSLVVKQSAEAHKEIQELLSVKRQLFLPFVLPH